MRIFGLDITRAKAAAVSAVDSSRGWFNVIREGFTGAWQSHVEVDAPKDVLAFSAVFSCVTVIASDIAKLRVRLVREDKSGICAEVRAPSPFWTVLRRPNRYQNRIKFIEQWIVSKLLHGNVYALKERDGRGVVVALYILDPQRVKVLVTERGDVYYELAVDHLSALTKTITVPASEIIHDMMVSLWHPLVGVSPIYACGVSATMGNRIQANSTVFFDNMSRPAGQLTAPGEISDETAGRLKSSFEENFSGKNIGRLLVAGSGLKYEAMTIPAQEAQLIEQLKWTVEDVARCFHVPLYKIGGPVPAGSSIESLNQGYYSDCLQALIESAELCLDEGLGLPADYYTEFDLDGLLRMDQKSMAEVEERLQGAGVKAPNESRQRFNLAPVAGGESPYLQQQNYSLSALAKRDAKADPFEGDAKPLPTAENDDEGAVMAAAAALFVKGLEAEHAGV